MATALLLVGSIYIIIFSFIVTMAGYGVRTPIEPFLTTKELLLIRIFAPLTLYAPLSLSYSMISLCFKVPFQAKFVSPLLRSPLALFIYKFTLLSTNLGTTMQQDSSCIGYMCT